jgi:2-keto-4-pentenoate hydratase/2-oxohepta-3-ene-1,7-dioic acid hydratase in catechol pathway
MLSSRALATSTFSLPLRRSNHILKCSSRNTPAAFLSSTSGGRGPVRPRASIDFDFEGELAVVIGERCRHVPRASALSVCCA